MAARLIVMTPDDLKSRTKTFAVRVIQFARSIPVDPIDNEIASQLTDARLEVLRSLIRESMVIVEC